MIGERLVWCNGAKAQKFKGTKVQRCKGTKAKRHKGVKVQRHSMALLNSVALLSGAEFLNYMVLQNRMEWYSTMSSSLQWHGASQQNGMMLYNVAVP